MLARPALFGVVVLAVALGGCSSSGASTTHLSSADSSAFGNWSSAGGKDSIDNLYAAVTVAQNHDVAAGDTALFCNGVRIAARNAQGAKQIPVASLQAEWAAALSGFVQSATDCTNGYNNNDQALITKGTNEMITAIGHFNVVGKAH